MVIQRVGRQLRVMKKTTTSHYTKKIAAYVAKRREYEFIEFGIVKAVEKLSRRANAIEVLKKALGDQDPEAGDAGPNHQD
ncbi:hypothetical protein Hanom_Chr11g00981021 [Helianthus anomalus]